MQKHLASLCTAVVCACVVLKKSSISKKPLSEHWALVYDSAEALTTSQKKLTKPIYTIYVRTETYGKKKVDSFAK